MPAASVAALQAYAGKPGKLLLLLDPGAPTGVENLFAEHGLTVDGDKIFRKVAVLSTAGLTQGLNDEVVGTRFSDHPAIRWIDNVGGSLRLGPSRSLTLKPAGPASTVKPEMLVETSDRYSQSPVTKTTWGCLASAATAVAPRIKDAKEAIRLRIIFQSPSTLR